MSTILRSLRLTVLGTVVLVGAFGCGGKPTPPEKAVVQDTGRSSTPSVVVDSAQPAVIAEAPTSDLQEQDTAKPIPPDTSILELQVPPGVRVEIDGKDIGEQRRLQFRGLEPKQWQQREATLRFPDGPDVKRTLLIRGGEVIRLPLPRSDMIRPELVMQTGHNNVIPAVAFSPDGKQVLTGSADHAAVLWDVASGQKLRAFQGHSERVNAVAFSPDGKQILTGSWDKTAVLWDVVTGQKLRAFQGHTWGVNAVAFSPDGKQILTGSNDKTAAVWDTASGQKQRVFQGHTDDVRAVAFSPDGRQVLTGALDKTAVLWDVASGQKIRAFNGHVDKIRAVAFSPDGKHVVTGSETLVMLWNVANGQEIRGFGRESTGKVCAVAFSPDGRQILTGAYDKTAVLWDLASGQKLRAFGSGVHAVAFSPDGRQVLTSCHDNRVVVWDVASGQQFRVFRGHDCMVYAVAFSPDGKWVLSGSYDKTAVLWDVASGQKLRVFRGHTWSVTAVGFSPDGRQILTGDRDKRVLWDVASGQKVRAFQGHTDRVLAVAFSPDGTQVLTGSMDKTAVLWDAASGEKLRVTFLGHTWAVTTVAFSPDGKQILTGSDDKTAVLWDAATGQKLRAFLGHTDMVATVAFSPDGNQVLTGSTGMTAVLWDTASGQKLRAFQAHDFWVHTVAFSPDGNQILTSSQDGPAVLWDVASGQKLRAFQGHTQDVNAVVFSPNGRHIVTASTDGTMRLWDIATGDELCSLISIDAGQDWAVVTPEGLFDGSKGGREKVFFRLGNTNNIVPLDRFFQDFYYPGLLAAIWRGERPMPGKPFQTNPAPSIKMLVNADSNQKDRVTVDVTLTDQGGGIKPPTLRHNGAAVRTQAALLRKEDKTHHYRFTLPLVRGENRIEVRSATANGSLESEPAVHTITFDGTLPEPELHVVAIGINRYANDSGISNLEFCVPDAQAIADVFRQRTGKLYKQVHVTPLFDDQATRANILSAVKTISQKARPQDTLVLFAASHGITVGQRYYLIPHDFKLSGAAPPTEPTKPPSVGVRSAEQAKQREEAIRQFGLAIDDLGDALAEVPALKRVLIFDTCHSGSVVGLKQNPFAFRGAIERFGRAQGVYSLTATAADELAAENKELGHSILTYSLLAGLGAIDRGPLKGQSIKPGKEGVDVLDWFRFAKQHVPKLYEQYVGRPQHIEISGEDQPGFALVTVPAR